MPRKSEVKIEVITDKPLSSMEVWQNGQIFFKVLLRFQEDEETKTTKGFQRLIKELGLDKKEKNY